MKLFQALEPPGVSTRIVAVLVICSALLAHVSSMDETAAEEQHPDEVFIDGDHEEQNLMHRERRQVKNNSSPKLADMEKRLQVLETK